ncbi:hypothetical protein SEA_LILBEANIE_34 [Gordonia phage Lilbeanie]|uniref:LtfC/p132/Gp6 beta-sandwich domain-containing protein n=1 Tax=Gordonia phage Lilbeanie TaxID=2794947 RepID=A0A7T1KSB9_9CAUD|nr:hypothetical protein J1773_gp34 [Gordonia phage Lilbeanie]QPO17112.1 hypothetical protein SEA_LILBEANIE_34 [Gordonia phage Lilbeanie]
MTSTWRGDADVRNLTVYAGEDADISGKLRQAVLNEDGRIVRYEPWEPGEDAEVFFRVFRDVGDGGTLDIPVTVTGSEFAVHIETTVLDTFAEGVAFWLYVATPDTSAGNPKVATVGRVTRVDPN